MIAAILSLGCIGMVAAVALGFAAKKFAVEVDPRELAALDVLPGINCGACGFAGCPGAAEAVVKGDAPVNVCLPGGEEIASKVAEIMGIEYNTEGKIREYAVVLCQGNNVKAKNENGH